MRQARRTQCGTTVSTWMCAGSLALLLIGCGAGESRWSRSPGAVVDDDGQGGSPDGGGPDADAPGGGTHGIGVDGAGDGGQDPVPGSDGDPIDDQGGAGGDAGDAPAGATGGDTAGDDGAATGGAPDDEFNNQGGGTGEGGDGGQDGGEGGDPGADGGDGGDIEGGPDGPGGAGERLTMEECFADIGGDLGPAYGQFAPIVGSHCKGTNHQEIQDIERLVFLGDSVTLGTPPWLITDWYWVRLYEALKVRFGDELEVQNCAQWGARTDDLLDGKGEIADCFPNGGDDRKTLVIMTIGGNDLANWASNALGVDEALVASDLAADYLDAALAWFREPDRFPNGIDVIVGTPYEFTDATGDVASCPASALAGLDGNWIEGAPAVIHLHERYMEMAVRHGIDLVFLLEAFCGHGYHHDDPESQCYRGPDAELWFDFTCIHPNPLGHSIIAEMFDAVVGE